MCLPSNTTLFNRRNDVTAKYITTNKIKFPTSNDFSDGRITLKSTTANGKGTNPKRRPTISDESENALRFFVCAKSKAKLNVYSR